MCSSIFPTPSVYSLALRALLAPGGWTAVKVPSGPGQLRKEQWRGRLLRGYRPTLADNLVHVNHFSPRVTPDRPGAGGLLRHCDHARRARTSGRIWLARGSLSMEPAWIAPCRADSARWSASSSHLEPAGVRAPIMSSPAISIVIPTFNNVDVLRQCVDGWRQHGGPDVELVVVEDGCVDSTPSYLDEVSATPWGKRQLRWLHEENSHELRCTNRGMTSARGHARSWPGRTICSCAPAGWCRSWCERSPPTTTSGSSA